ncbi:MAG TPA: dihydrolipoyllysine-residue acetyltransferase [Aeromonadales bacterium]|nr:dihydrolipoyllysine-residue acetyltransferase [Aeromonadales bacterium]
MKQILIPDLGDIGEVDVIEIPIEVGDEIQKEDTMVVLESDKATMEVPAPEGGIVKEILLHEGDKVKEGSAVIMLEPSANIEPSANTETVTESDETAVGSDSTKAESTAESTAEERVDEIEIAEITANDAKPQLVDLTIPDIGDLDEVEVIELNVSRGDVIEKEQTLLVLESDKASMDVPSSLAGEIIELTVKVGDKVKTGTVIGKILTRATVPDLTKTSLQESVESSKVENSTKTSTSEQKSTLATTSSRPPVPERPATSVPPRKGLVHASPAVRRFARELGADLSKVKGSGPKSRVLKEDVRQFIKDELSRPKATVVSGGLAVADSPKIDFSKFGEIEEVSLSRIQKISSVNLHRNWVNIPHVTQFDEADITELEAFRKSLKAEAESEGIKMTPLIFMLKAVASALKAFPEFNASLGSDGETLILKKYIHIGVAVDTPNGLVVPVIRDVDQKSIFALAAELGEVSQKAREGKLSPASMQGSCFSISSLGGIGGTAFTPIVNWPDVAILGVSKSQMKPVWNGTEFEPRLMLPLSLSYDHRVIDGALAARFSVHLAKILGDIRRILLK